MMHGMGGAAGALMIAVMAVVMLGMAGFSLAFLGRAVPAAWRGRIRKAIRRPASPAPGGGREGAR